MARYVALLRGVSPMNCTMQALRACMEGAGFERVKTLLSSGNVAFVDFMVKLERTFGKHITTRTWDTVCKCAAA